MGVVGWLESTSYQWVGSPREPIVVGRVQASPPVIVVADVGLLLASGLDGGGAACCCVCRGPWPCVLGSVVPSPRCGHCWLASRGARATGVGVAAV